MSRRAQAIYTSSVTIGAPRAPPAQATHTRPLFCFWSLLYPSPSLPNEKGNKSFMDPFHNQHRPPEIPHFFLSSLMQIGLILPFRGEAVFKEAHTLFLFTMSWGTRGIK